MKYDFTFAELAIKFIETADDEHLRALEKTDAAAHIINHAKHFGGLNDSQNNFFAKLLGSINKESLPKIVQNIDFARKYIVGKTEKIVLEYLPKGASLSGTMFFTCGYDIGVVYGKNCSLNLAHPKFLTDMQELKYYAVHELHHAGFYERKNGAMPSLAISTRGEMAGLIEELTHLEGMGTFAPLALRTQENALNTDDDYIALQNDNLLNEYMREYLEIYRHFKDNPNETLTENDWQKLEILSDGKRLWYICGAHMAGLIDERFGREYLMNLIDGAPEKFILQGIGTVEM